MRWLVLARRFVSEAALIYLMVLSTEPVAHVEFVAEPYGGCKEAAGYPDSPGADDCRALGWTIGNGIAVPPSSDSPLLTTWACVWDAWHPLDGVRD